MHAPGPDNTLLQSAGHGLWRDDTKGRKMLMSGMYTLDPQAQTTFDNTGPNTAEVSIAGRGSWLLKQTL